MLPRSLGEEPMDPVTLGYYALVCGALGVTAPRWRTPALRFLVGILVGLVAAALLPQIRQMLAGG
jgi:hypothetical protein